ncbi:MULTISPECIES: ROK family protein [Micromonospora]|uniref:Sugar kinase of the NBD/HSP70 family, may contain an N-terminal HTH domain n=1 Tax=Micromonospora rifamycinica TaxID=291594 RepID=A0A125Q0W7_9ACTN|nr:MULTISPECIES: ROK family protein [Micromonospora]KWV30336.1 ROK family transcriptional regulator [Micromonospora rifamycinica]WFE62303.1 ROK family protein [Micromonospora sp. WMMD714]WFE94761.1 ROK family protein [Micromonospora sp. WMMD987]SCG79124.1 Sugar kinase of the NBD/HSP70 family, may contain an N-terminal HTH domain [Micromonospora rifamycinica]
MRVGPSQDEIRRQNLGALLRHVHVHGATSRAELTTALGLNRSTIGALTADLAGAGLVSEGTPKETGRAGRPSLVVRPESARVYAYAYSIEVDRLRAARVGLGGEVLDRRELDRPRDLDAAETTPMLAGALKQMRERVPAGSICVGAGVAVCGMVRKADGLVRLGPTTGWVDEPIGAALAAEVGVELPVTVGNVADVAAFAEHARGVAAGCDNVIYLYGDVGVGAGIIAGGRRLTGHGGYGGEVGHMVVVRDGTPCECGSRGCWETQIGEYGLLRAAGRSDARGREALLAVFDAADRGDARAQTAVRHAGDWLGFGVANLVNIFNPEMVIFGGTMRDLYLAAAAQVRSRLNETGLPACLEHVRLRTPKLGDDAALIGAAELAFERLLADPLDVG